ncbi:MAG: hypothetical protein Q9198_005913 [Flavoplaca austrocitrina]
MVEFPPGAADSAPIRYHPGYSTYRRPSQGMLNGASGRSAGEWFGGGLPTPPATADMAVFSMSSGRGAYQQAYPYLTEQRSSAGDNGNIRPAAYASNGKVFAGDYESRTHSNPQTCGTNGTIPQEDQIASHLQIPGPVNSSKGSLPEFAAEITCLFWFESSETLEYAESLPDGAVPDRGLNADAIPSIGFRKWVTTVLSTTQVGKNVILLALMFIYRLKKFNRSVSGKRGSEFRLLTIALMLGNKFLDDNTYTNKTWAEVSGISVNEIHIMEVEFLSNMRYELYASQAEWVEWQSKLGRFCSFYQKASRFNRSNAISPVTPLTQATPHKLPSPPSGYRPVNGGYANLPNPMHTLPHLPRSPVRHSTGMEHPIGRKRSLDTSLDLPPAKRIHSTLSTSTNLPPNVLTPNSVFTPDLANTTASYDLSRMTQLPLPTLPNPANRNGMQLAPLSLPGPRAMSAVYPNSTASSQPVTPDTVGPVNLPLMPTLGTGAASSTPRVPSHAGSAHTSPTNMYGTGTPTRPGLSPSYFLINRSSPYRPVRHVNTLLYPPPSGALQHPIKNIDYQQMHYQPLSKIDSQLRSGPMPCLQPDAWAGYALTPGSHASRPY